VSDLQDYLRFFIGARLGKTGLNVATRLLGLLLAALAIQTMAEGLTELFPGLAT
jgi:multiple antibiotic resistance protein